MTDLIKKFKKFFKTDFIYPENFLNFKVLGLFSKKLSKDLNIYSLSKENFFEFFFPKQVHGVRVVEIVNSCEVPLPFSVEGDAVITDKRGIFIGVRTADCVPILFATLDRRLIGAVHAGWRGSVKKILEKTLKRLLRNYKPEEVLLAIGPHIKVCCYQVGEDVLKWLSSEFCNYKEFIKTRDSRFYLDLEKLNLYQALSLGIPRKNIWISKDCTHCLSSEYWSYRYHGEKRGFQISVIGLV